MYSEPEPHGWWGTVYSGDVYIGDGLKLSGTYSIMQHPAEDLCEEGKFGGIFGIGPKTERSLVTDLQTGESEYWGGNIFSGTTLDWPQVLSDGSCGQPVETVPNPLMQQLKQDTEQARLGIYWSGQMGQSEGALYLGPTADTDNPHYDQTTALKANLVTVGEFKLNITSYAVGAQEVKLEPQWGSNAFFDTGIAAIGFPEALSLKKNEILKIKMEGPSGPIVLELPLGWLPRSAFRAQPSSSSMFLLGSPLLVYYYVMFNIKGNTVDFTPHKDKPASDIPQEEWSGDWKTWD